MSNRWQKVAIRLDPWWTATLIACMAAVIAAVWIDWWLFQLAAIAALVILIALATVYWAAIVEAWRNRRKRRNPHD